MHAVLCFALFLVPTAPSAKKPVRTSRARTAPARKARARKAPVRKVLARKATVKKAPLKKLHLKKPLVRGPHAGTPIIRKGTLKKLNLKRVRFWPELKKCGRNARCIRRNYEDTRSRLAHLQRSIIKRSPCACFVYLKNPAYLSALAWLKSTAAAHGNDYAKCMKIGRRLKRGANTVTGLYGVPVPAMVTRIATSPQADCLCQMAYKIDIPRSLKSMRCLKR